VSGLPHGPAGDVPAVSVPDIRDYQKINAELRRLLDEGHPIVELAGVNRQRLLISGLVGQWHASIVVVGNPGPELAAELDAPHLRIHVMGSVADGVARGMKAGRVIVAGQAGDGSGYSLRGGGLLIEGAAGHRTGLMMSGGTIIVRGGVGRLVAERQIGGTIFVADPIASPLDRRGASNGRLIRVGGGLPVDEYQRALREFDIEVNT